jgi:hypothetical protein
VSIGRQAAEGRELVDAVLGAAGWEADTIKMAGLSRAVTRRAEPVFEAPARRHVNARATLRVAPLDGRRLVLWVDGRLPLLVPTANVEVGDHDPVEDVLRAILEWQERLGEGEGDAGFWRALLAIGVRGLTLKDGMLDGTLDWSRLDADGCPQGGYLLQCACQALKNRPSECADVVKVVRDIVHEGWSEIFCACRRCGRRWKVDEDTSYHFTTWQWSDVTNESEHAVHYE